MVQSITAGGGATVTIQDVNDTAGSTTSTSYVAWTDATVTMPNTDQKFLFVCSMTHYNDSTVTNYMAVYDNGSITTQEQFYDIDVINKYKTTTVNYSGDCDGQAIAIYIKTGSGTMTTSRAHISTIEVG